MSSRYYYGRPNFVLKHGRVLLNPDYAACVLTNNSPRVYSRLGQSLQKDCPSILRETMGSESYPRIYEFSSRPDEDHSDFDFYKMLLSNKQSESAIPEFELGGPRLLNGMKYHKYDSYYRKYSVWNNGFI